MSLQTSVLRSSSQPYFDVFGPRVQYLNTPDNSDSTFACIRASIPSGVAIPLHSHPDPELLLIQEGSLEFMHYVDGNHRWDSANPGDVVSVPPNVKHSFRNVSSKSVDAMLITTPNIFHFFRELGKPYFPDQPMGLPTAEDMQKLVVLCQKYNYWLASPDENRGIGL